MRRPRFIAEQARNARGIVGRVIASIMGRETWAQNLRAIQSLGLEPDDHILDVGCGHGRSLAVLGAGAPKGHVVGADPSELMAKIAVERNRALVRKRRVEVIIAGVEALPFPAASFDKVLCVHVVYFWKDLDAGLREIARVLKPGGRLALLFRTSADEASMRSFPPEVYRIPELRDVLSGLTAAGFEVEAVDQGSEPVLVVAGRRGATTAP